MGRIGRRVEMVLRQIRAWMTVVAIVERLSFSVVVFVVAGRCLVKSEQAEELVINATQRPAR